MLTTKKQFFPAFLTVPGQRTINTLRINSLYTFDNNRLAKVRLFFELTNKLRYFFLLLFAYKRLIQPHLGFE